jgi:hypothetical protein
MWRHSVRERKATKTSGRVGGKFVLIQLECLVNTNLRLAATTNLLFLASLEHSFGTCQYHVESEYVCSGFNTVA